MLEFPILIAEYIELIYYNYIFKFFKFYKYNNTNTPKYPPYISKIIVLKGNIIKRKLIEKMLKLII